MKNDGSAKFEAYRKLQSEKAKQAWKNPGTKERHIESTQYYYDFRAGKTDVELYGEEKAAEIRKKRSDAQKAIVHTPERNKKVSLGLFGKKFSPKRCKNMSEARKGVPTKPRSPEAKANMSRAQRARLGETMASFRGESWTKAVKERDNFTCQDCGVTQTELTKTKKGMSSYLQAHHIKPREEFPQLQFELDNGITYCPPCHSKNEAIEKKRVLINMITELTESVYDLTAAYGILDDHDEEVISRVEQKIEDFHRVLRFSKLLGPLAGIKKHKLKSDTSCIPQGLKKYFDLPVQ